MQGMTAEKIVVYPRAGGGTLAAPCNATPCLGLSPRRRGNRWAAARPRTTPGSIPAQAGEPSCSARCANPRWVYPRAGGGTAKSASHATDAEGLSPRRRGNRRATEGFEGRQGSIPAQAGEPTTPRPRSCPERVYPRAGGGTAIKSGDLNAFSGLSPRRRGNHAQRLPCGEIVGSIPAQAGEPSRSVPGTG